MLRFTVRDVLWLTVLIGLSLGWWVDRSRLATAMGKALLWRGRGVAQVARNLGLKEAFG